MLVTYVYSKYGDDRLWNEKALADRKSDNNIKNENTNNARDHWGSVSGSNNNLFNCYL